MDQERPTGNAFPGGLPGNGEPERGRVVTRVTKDARVCEIIEMLRVQPGLDMASTMSEIPDGPRDIMSVLSVRALPPAAGPLSSRIGYIRAGLGCLGAALKQHGNVVQGWLTISKPYELRGIVASGA